MQISAVSQIDTKSLSSADRWCGAVSLSYSFITGPLFFGVETNKMEYSSMSVEGGEDVLCI